MTILDGKQLRDKKIEELKNELRELKEKLGLAVIQVGNDEASNVYVKQKENLAKNLGYEFIHEKLDESITTNELINYIETLNYHDYIDGIIVQMPLPKHIDEKLVQNSIDPFKDVDGLTFINQGKLLSGEETLIPCTPKGVIDLLQEYNIEIEGKNIVVVGRSVLVGKPLSILLTNRNATVTLCHSKTINLSEYTKEADILISAVGKKHIITEDMVKNNAVVIDVGITRVDGKLYGDVDFDNVVNKASFITPVPGGVGPMTVYELMNNVKIAHVLRKTLT